MIKNILKIILRKVTKKSFRHKLLIMLKEQRLNKLKFKIIHYYKDFDDFEITKLLKYLKTHKLEVFNYNFIDNYNNRNIKVCYDKNCNLYYVKENNKKMYFSRIIDTKEKVISYYNSISLEQDLESPHRYIFDKQKEYECVLDLGVAEGNFALDIIDNTKELYLFEADNGWIEALEHTFEPYKDKVHIINKYVSNQTNGKEVRLDDFFKDKHKCIDMIKMDIEGAEIVALEGLNEIVYNNNIELNICAYHNQDDEIKIKKHLKGFNITTNGYIVFHYDKNLKAPYLRRGVLHCTKK